MDVSAVPASGLVAAQTILNVTANNIVNAETPNYDAEEVDLTTDPTGAVSIDGIDQTGRPVDLATETITQKNAALMYDANAVIVKVAENMYGSLLNVLDTQDQNSASDNS